MQRNGVEAARRKLPELVERAHRGEASYVTRHGEIRAAIVPPEWVETRSTVDSPLDIRTLRGTGKGLWGRSATSTIRKMRDEWER